MSNRLRQACALVLVISVLGSMALGCAGSSGREEHQATSAAAPLSSKSTPEGDTTSIPKTAPAKDAGAVPEVPNQVTIDNFRFTPREMTVPAGTMVTWVNRDDVPHTATSTAKPKRFDSGTLDTDDKYSFVFSTPGTYEYFCAVHPHMTGKIIVK